MDTEQKPPADEGRLERRVRALDPERSDFEAWALREGYSTKKVANATGPDGLEVYDDPRTHAAWWAWQEARAWILTSERKPRGGQLIVKRWRHGAVWAGTHDEGPKNESFQEWKAL